MDIATKLHCIDLRSTVITGSTLLPCLSPFPSTKTSACNNSLKPAKSNVISNHSIKFTQISSELSAVALELPETDIREDVELLFTDNSTLESERKQSNAGASTISSGIRLVNIRKSYNGVSVLENVNWEVAEGEKVGLVGANGTAKTTQLRIIAGQEEPDSGAVIKAKNLMKIAFLNPECEISMSRTVKEEFMSVLMDELKVDEESEKVQDDIEGASDNSDFRIMDEIDTLETRARTTDLLMVDAKINKLMVELGFAPEDSDRLVASFGDGWRMRIALGKILIQNPDLLLLDEPTEHVDVDTVSWLSGYLRKQDVSVVISSGDTVFLDQLCTKIVETNMGLSRTFHGNYSDYVIAKDIEHTRNIIDRLVAGPNVGQASAADKSAFQASLVSEEVLESEEAVIAAASAEAVSLAKTAVKFARDAAAMAAQSSRFVKLESESKSFQPGGNSLFMDSEFSGSEDSSSDTNINGTSEVCLTHHSVSEPDDLEPSNEDLELLQSELSDSVAVKSMRQLERKAKRARAVEKASAGVVPIKLTSSSRRKRTSIQQVDYSDPLRHIRGTTSGSKLLTAREELELSAGIQDLLKLEKLYDELHKRRGDEPTFGQWAAAAGVDLKTLRKRVNYGTLCKDRMIKSNIRLVISIAKNYQGVGMNLQDLVQEGCRGLVRGAEKFDASKGFKFSTYAHWWIKQAVRKSLSDQSRTIRLPFHMVEATYRVKEAKKQLYSENGRQPNNEEVAEATGLSMKRLNAVLLTPKAPRSLDQKIGINENLKPSEVIADPEAETAEDLLMKQFMRQDLEKVLDSLSLREKQVVRWRFGLEDGRMKTLQEIGEMMGVSRERIRQIESSAFRKLTKKKTKHLQQYVLS